MAKKHLLLEANWEQMKALAPTLAVLPWGATEAHNRHLPYGTDVIEAATVADRAAELANQSGARVIVLPVIPYGNDAQQLDQVATIHLRTSTAIGILRDVCDSLKKQGIGKLMILNAHGGNDFKPLVRDIQLETGMLIVVCNFWQMIPERVKEIFDEPGDHAGELETSLLMHWRPDLVALDQAGEGGRVPFHLAELSQPGVWTPRPWSRSHPDMGAGNPRRATAEKGKRFFEAASAVIAKLMSALANAPAEKLP